MWQNVHYISENQNLTLCTSVPNDAKKILKKYEFFTTFDLNQLIVSPTRITCSSSLIIDNILAGFPDIVTQQRILNGRLFDHQLIYCARKISKTKRSGHRQIKISFFQGLYSGYL